MTNEELRRLFISTHNRSEELRVKHESGHPLSRRDALEMEQCNRRLHLIGHELLLLIGSDDPAFDIFRRPHVKQPLPKSIQPLDLSDCDPIGGTH